MQRKKVHFRKITLHYETIAILICELKALFYAFQFFFFILKKINKEIGENMSNNIEKKFLFFKGETIRHRYVQLIGTLSKLT